MGMKLSSSAASTPAAALFTRTQRRVLGLLFGEPDRTFYASELIMRTGAGSGAVQRELKRLLESGLLTVTAYGRQKHYQANPDCPLFAELTGLIQRIQSLESASESAPPQPVTARDWLRQALAPLAERLERAALLDPPPNGDPADPEHLEVLVVGDVEAAELTAALASAEAALGQTVELIHYSAAEFRRRRFAASPVVLRLLARSGEDLLASQPPPAARD